MTLVAGPFSLKNQFQRLVCFSAIVNLFRLMRLLEPSVPDNIPRVGVLHFFCCLFASVVASARQHGCALTPPIGPLFIR